MIVMTTMSLDSVLIDGRSERIPRIIVGTIITNKVIIGTPLTIDAEIILMRTIVASLPTPSRGMITA